MIKEIIADIYFFSEKENGRKSDITNTSISYRPMLCYENNNYHCQIDFGENELIKLGHNYRLRIRVMYMCPIEQGAKFQLKETRIIGTGEVINIL